MNQVHWGTAVKEEALWSAGRRITEMPYRACGADAEDNDPCLCGAG